MRRSIRTNVYDNSIGWSCCATPRPRSGKSSSRTYGVYFYACGVIMSLYYCNNATWTRGFRSVTPLTCVAGIEWHNVTYAPHKVSRFIENHSYLELLLKRSSPRWRLLTWMIRITVQISYKLAIPPLTWLPSTSYSSLKLARMLSRGSIVLLPVASFEILFEEPYYL